MTQEKKQDNDKPKNAEEQTSFFASKFEKNNAKSSGASSVSETSKLKIQSGTIVIDEDWIRARSELELSELIKLASSELVRRRSKPTDKLPEDDMPLDFREMSEIPWENYKKVPAGKDTGELAKKRTWHVVLISSDKSHKPLPLKVVGDAVLGRSDSDIKPEIDLNPLDASNLGISRSHALLRPKSDQLLLSDLGSTNGTLLDGEKLVLGRPGVVRDQSVITMGKLHFKVRITRRPGQEDEAQDDDKDKDKDKGKDKND